MKKMTALLLTGMMVLGAGAMNVSAAENGEETVNISALNAQGEIEEMEVPFDPQRVAILDFAALDIMDNLGLGDRVVGCASTTLDYLKKYTEQDGVEKLGTIKEADLEAVMACEPDVIFIGGRLSKSYDALSEIAPVVYLATDMEKGVVESTHDNAEVIASIFGMEDQVEEKFAGFAERIAALQDAAEGKTAVIGMCTSGSFNVLGNDGRCSIIGTEIGFDNLCKETSSERSGNGERGGQNGGEGKGEESAERTDNAENAEGADNAQGGTATHGNEASFELIVSLNPDYIFVMDRDAAIGTEGAQLAKDIMENELVMGTDAYTNGNLVYLENPAVWYTAEGGITALDTMLNDLETALVQE